MLIHKKNILHKTLRPIISSSIIAISCVSGFSQAAVCEHDASNEWSTEFVANTSITNDTDTAINLKTAVGPTKSIDWHKYQVSGFS